MVIYIYISIAGFHLFVNKCWQKNAPAGRKFPLYGAFSGMAEVNHIKKPGPGKRPEQAFFSIHCKRSPKAGGKTSAAGERELAVFALYLLEAALDIGRIVILGEKVVGSPGRLLA